MDVARELASLPLSAPQTVQERFLSRVTVSSWIDLKTCVLARCPSTVDEMPEYMREARSPINVNTASEEVIAAVLWDLKASPVLPNNRVARQLSSDGVVRPGTLYDETELSSTARHVAISLVPNRDTALLIARELVEYRKLAPFKTWAEFHKVLKTMFELNPALVPDDGGVIEEIHPNPTAPEIRDREIGERMWREACVDIIYANCNPNGIENKFNPSHYAFLRTAKSDLFAENPLTGAKEKTHSTEFCFAPTGIFEITSLGQVLTEDGRTLAMTLLCSEVSLLSLYRHTTQEDFEAPGTLNGLPYPEFIASTSYPAVVDKNLGWTPDAHVGSVEPAVSHRVSGGELYASAFAVPRGDTPRLPLSNSDRFNCYPETLQSMKIGTRFRDPENNLLNDGILSDYRQFSTPSQLRYHSIPAMPAGVSRGENCPGGSNISYYEGTLEFWVKLTEHSNTQMGCGLLSATFVNPNPPYTEDGEDPYKLPHPYSEGVQFYIFKNTLGELRFSRIYFCLTYDNNGAPIGTHYTSDADGWNAGAESWRGGVVASGFYFPVPRQEVVVRAGELDWAANTWHHIAVSWGNKDPANPMTVTIDGEEKEVAIQDVFFTPQTSDPEFCLLNERGPRDCFNICGFFGPR